MVDLVAAEARRALYTMKREPNCERIHCRRRSLRGDRLHTPTVRRVSRTRGHARPACHRPGTAGQGQTTHRTVVLPRSIRTGDVRAGRWHGRRSASAHRSADGHVAARRRDRARRQPGAGSTPSSRRREHHDVGAGHRARRADAGRQHGPPERRAALDRASRPRPPSATIVSASRRGATARASRRHRPASSPARLPVPRRRPSTFPIWSAPTSRFIRATS